MLKSMSLDPQVLVDGRPITKGSQDRLGDGSEDVYKQ